MPKISINYFISQLKILSWILHRGEFIYIEDQNLPLGSAAEEPITIMIKDIKSIPNDNIVFHLWTSECIDTKLKKVTEDNNEFTK